MGEKGKGLALDTDRDEDIQPHEVMGLLARMGAHSGNAPFLIGPMRGGCGHGPDRHIMRGTWGQCADWCLSSGSCTKFQRDEGDSSSGSIGTCYFNGDGDTEQTVEPNGNVGWTCTFKRR